MEQWQKPPERNGDDHQSNFPPVSAGCNETSPPEGRGGNFLKLVNDDQQAPPSFLFKEMASEGWADFTSICQSISSSDL
jgi:hypothetical protein